jgi:transposase
MPKPLSKETRENIIYHHKNGAKNTEIVKWLRVSTASVERIIRMHREGKSIEEKTYKRGRKPAFCEAKMNKITEKIREQPDITLEELKEQFHLNISISALCRKLIKRGLTYKKRRCFQRNNSAQTCNGFEASG